jgi:four helix bundle protein
MQDYHRLEIWRRAMDYAADLYRLAADWPDAERYNLMAQVRKAVASVPLNIAEGSGCLTNAEFARFLGFAYRSLKEIVACLELSQRLYPAAPSQATAALIDEGNQIARMTHSLIGRLDADSKLTTQNSRLKTQDSKLRTQNSKLNTQEQTPMTDNSELTTTERHDPRSPRSARR